MVNISALRRTASAASGNTKDCSQTRVAISGAIPKLISRGHPEEAPKERFWKTLFGTK
jgi:hypothetical protein